MVLKSQIKYIQSLGDKKFRDQEGVFVAEGPKVLREFLDTSPLSAVQLFALKDWISDTEAAQASWGNPPLAEVDPLVLGRMSNLKTPNRVLGIFRKPSPADLVPAKQLSLVLDNIQDPGNLGTIIRIADWFGIQAIYCSLDCADAFGPKSVQSTMGSIGRVGLRYLEIYPLLQSCQDLPIYAAVLDGENIFDTRPSKEAMIIIGNESQGIRSEVLGLVNHHITIPRKGRAESLNAAVAAGIILAQLSR